MLAEPVPVKLDQPMPMPVLLAPHLGELLRLGWVILLQPVRKIVIDARVLFLLGNGERENLLLRKALKRSHKRNLDR